MITGISVENFKGIRERVHIDVSPIMEHEAMEWSKLHSFERDSVIPEKQLIATALRHGVGNVSVEGIRR